MGVHIHAYLGVYMCESVFGSVCALLFHVDWPPCSSCWLCIWAYGCVSSDDAPRQKLLSVVSSGLTADLAELPAVSRPTVPVQSSGGASSSAGMSLHWWSDLVVIYGLGCTTCRYDCELVLRNMSACDASSQSTMLGVSPRWCLLRLVSF